MTATSRPRADGIDATGAETIELDTPDGVGAAHARFAPLVVRWAEMLLDGDLRDDVLALYTERAIDLAFALREESHDELAASILESVLLDVVQAARAGRRSAGDVLARCLGELTAELLEVYGEAGDHLRGAELLDRYRQIVRDLVRS